MNSVSQMLIGIIPLTALIVEGYICTRILLPTSNRNLQLALALPLSSLINALLTIFLQITNLSLTPLSLGIGHIVIIATLFVVQWKYCTKNTHEVPQKIFPPISKWILWPCITLLSMQFIYSASHALLLPSFQYDSATNWTMRSKISFIDKRLAFDRTEDRGMAKPQYPILFHALQITANQGQNSWSDVLANTVLFLLSLSCLAGTFLILKNIVGPSIAFISLTLMTNIPLLALHLAQGYGDITLILFEVLALLGTLSWIISKDDRGSLRWLIFAGLMIAAGVWTKLEGVSLGLIPWIITMIILTWRTQRQWKSLTLPIGIALLLSILWPIFALSHGLSLTPHAGDASFAWHPEAFKEVFLGLFSRGSFGIHWYTAIIASALILWKYRTKVQSIFLLWGWIVFFEVIAIYTLTPNVRFLLNAESFYRQAMLPLALLSIIIPYCFQEAKTQKGNLVTSPS